MDYYIVGVAPGKFLINKNNLKLLNANQLGGKQLGFLIDSWFEYDRESKTLSIVTNTKMDVVGKQIYNLAEFRCGTMLSFKNTKILYSGVNDISVPYVEFILNIAQAHSYGVFCAKCEENKMPLGGMEITPAANYREIIIELLEKNKTI